MQPLVKLLIFKKIIYLHELFYEIILHCYAFLEGVQNSRLESFVLLRNLFSLFECGHSPDYISL